MPAATKPIAAAKKAPRPATNRKAAKKPKSAKLKLPEKGPVPVTLLSGFLGAGKTTLLEHILKNKKGLRCAVVVNDMAEINIDSSLLKGTQLLQTQEQMVELQNGCICCTLREDLLLALREMALSNKFDVIVIESTGISEPMQVAETFYIDPEDGKGPLYNLARLDNCVTVVDASTFYDNLNSCDSIKEKERKDMDAAGIEPLEKAANINEADEEEEEEEEGDSGNISHLLIDQVEFSNVILLNKTDLVPAERVQATLNLLRSLNPTAKIICTRNSLVDVREMLFTGRFTEAFAQKTVGWMADINTNVKHTPETLEYGIGSFVYRSNRPFHPSRLHKLLTENFLVQEMVEVASEEEDEEDEEDNAAEETEEEAAAAAAAEDEEEEEIRKARLAELETIMSTRRATLGNMFRSKGYIWIGTPERHSSFGEWNHAGNLLRFNYSGEWRAFPGLGGAKDVTESATDENATLVQKAAQLASRAKEAAKGNSLSPFFHEKSPCQEIVMIGQDLDKEAITRVLDECLLTEEEQKQFVDAISIPSTAGKEGPKLFEDPFEPWMAPVGDDDEAPATCPLPL